MGNWISSNDTAALLDSLIADFATVVGGLAGAQVAAVPAAPSPGHALDSDALIWWQDFDAWPSAKLAVGAPAASWRGLGEAPMVALGETGGFDDETNRGTFLEYLAQLGGMAGSALSDQAGRQILPTNGRETKEWPSGYVERGVEFRLGDQTFPMWFAVPADFFASGAAVAPASEQDSEGGPDGEHRGSEAAALAQRSGTFDLLLEVEMAVSISFGRAMVPLREVARLTSGSVVELNRTVSDPVEVIVNNCVIARGEVVVVEGNYGVRIQQIISPRERLRTLH